MPRLLAPSCLALTALLLAPSVRAQEAFVPTRYAAGQDDLHRASQASHTLTVRKVSSAVENLTTGKVVVQGVTQVLNCSTGEMVQQERCDPCEYNLAEWAPRPLDTWVVEERWPEGAGVAEKQARLRVAHFNNFWKLGAEPQVQAHQGVVFAFWTFDGKRAAPLKPLDPQPAQAEAASPKREGPVRRIEATHQGVPTGAKVATQPGEDRIVLGSQAYYEGAGGVSRSQQYHPMWASSCASIANAKGKEATITLHPGEEQCKVYLYEGRSGVESIVLIERGKEPPKIRLAITLANGREADGVALKGRTRKVVLRLKAFDGDDRRFDDIDPEWGIEGDAKVQFIDRKKKRHLRVVLDKGADRALVQVRDRISGATDEFVIEKR